MKITVYTISDCKFSQQEKDYLKANSLSFEEKNLELNKDYLTEMLTVSNNFAGTPVTKIEKDSGETVVLKGFTKDEFDRELGLQKEEAPAVEAVAAAAAVTDQPAAEPAPQVQAPEAKKEELPSLEMPVADAAPSAMPEPLDIAPPAAMPEPMNAMPAAPAAMPPVAEPAAIPATPSIDMQPTPAAMPEIPDLSAQVQAMGAPAQESAMPAAMPEPMSTMPAAPAAMPPVAEPAAMPAPMNAMPAAMPEVTPTGAPSAPAAPAPQNDDALNAILNSLQEKVSQEAPQK